MTTENITIVPVETDLSVTEKVKTITQLPESIEIQVEVSQAADSVNVRYGHDVVHLLMNEISLSIRDVSLIDRIGENYGLIIHEQNVRISEDQVIAEDILTIRGKIEDPATGNVALASAIETLGVELNNHNGAMDAHAYKFTELETSIDDVANDVSVHSSAIQALESDVTANRDGWTANASDITTLQVDLSMAEGQIAAHGTAINSNYVRIIATENGISVNGQAIDSLDGAITNAISDVSANASAIDGITIRINDDETGLTATASRITELQANISNNFSPTIAWEFTHDVEGWQVGDGAQVTQADDSLIIDSTYSAGYAWVELDSAIDGATFPFVVLRWKRLSGSGWDGGIYYKYQGFGSWVLADSFDEPANMIDFHTTTMDMRSTGWEGRTITHLAIRLADTANNSFAIDSVGIGRVGSLGPYAYIKDNLTAWVGEDSALAQRVTELEVSVDADHVLITEETTARIDADDTIMGSYILEIDVNGYISGFGLMSTVLDGDPVSAFIVLADEFAVVLPGTVDEPVVPFSAGTYHNMPAVTIANAFIGDIIQSENFDDRHGWQIRLAGSGQGQAIFNDITIRDPQGQTIMSSGTGLQWDMIQGDDRPASNATRNFIYRTNTAPTDAVEGDLWYRPDNKMLYRRTGYGWEPIGTYTTHTSDLTDDANLGATAIWDQVSGYGKPTDFADQTSQNQAQSIVNQGLMATLDKITRDNVYTYFEEAVITTAFIADLAVGTAQIGELSVGTSKIANGAVSALTSSFSKTKISVPNSSVETIQSCGIISYEDYKVFLINCSATLWIPPPQIAMDEGQEMGEIGQMMWAVWSVKEAAYVYVSEVIDVSGSFQLSFSFEHRPVGNGTFVYHLHVYTTAAGWADGYPTASNRAMNIQEFKK